MFIICFAESSLEQHWINISVGKSFPEKIFVAVKKYSELHNKQFFEGEIQNLNVNRKNDVYD